MDYDLNGSGTKADVRRPALWLLGAMFAAVLVVAGFALAARDAGGDSRDTAMAVSSSVSVVAAQQLSPVQAVAAQQPLLSQPVAPEPEVIRPGKQCDAPAADPNDCMYD